MIELEEKYVLHIPLSKCADGELMGIDIDEIFGELANALNEIGVCSFYTAKVRGYYKSVEYDELLVSVFASENESETVKAIFRNWFLKNNTLMQQKEFAFEADGRLFIEKLC